MMKRSIAAVIAAATLGLAGAAGAKQEAQPNTDPDQQQQQQQQEQDPGMKPEMKPGAMNKTSADIDAAKRLGLVDFYLTDAINDAKLLSSLAEQPSGKVDRQILAEAKRNLDASIAKAIQHANQVKSPDIKGQTDAFVQDLKQAQLSAKKVPVTSMAQLSTSVDQVAAHLMAANDTFQQLSTTKGITRIETMKLSAAPVSGHEPGVKPPQKQNVPKQRMKGEEDLSPPETIPVPNTNPSSPENMPPEKTEPRRGY